MARLLGSVLSLNRIGFGLAYLLSPARAGQGWIGRAARRQPTQVFVRGHGARDLAIGMGALTTLLRHERGAARAWLAAGALADGADVASTLAARPRLPKGGFRFALVTAAASTAVGAFAAALVGRGEP